MKSRLLVSIAIVAFSSPAFAAWHYLQKVVKVTVRGDSFYVQGSGPTGHACADDSNYYGTLTHSSAQVGHKEYYSMALLAQATDKGMACYISSTLPNGVCIMETATYSSDTSDSHLFARPSEQR